MNSITISGILRGESKQVFRKLEFRLSDSVDSGIILCTYWTKNDQNVFMEIPRDKNIIIKGRFGYEKEIGVYLIVEEFEKLKPYENLAVH
ncbi:MAG: hypothetical protein MJ222_00240 [Bacilli bacterium]|nr:hypothetical protein [Bacilli bacterium]